jgi:hypothetical protein
MTDIVPAMLPFIVAALERIRRRRAPGPSSGAALEPVWRLLVGELRVLWTRVVARPARAAWLAMAATTAGVQVALSDLTPGPILDWAWRWPVGLAAGSGAFVACRYWDRLRAHWRGRR